MTEKFDVVDLNDRPIRQLARGLVHRDNLFHRAIHVLVNANSLNWILQQRSGNKDVDPFLWTSSCSGHVDAGEDYLSAAVRECEEELGIVADRKLFIEVFRASPCLETGNEFVRVYLLKYEKESRFNRNEILQIIEYPTQEIEELIRTRPETVSGSFLHLFPYVKKGIELNKSSLP